MVESYKKAFFLDRDGVLIKTDVHNGKPYAIHCEDQFELLPKVKKSIDIIKKNNYMVIVITNQPDVGNNLISKDRVIKINQLLMKNIHIDDLFVCYHSQSMKCSCRKPNIFFFNQAVKKHNISLKKSYMVGDRYSDIEAGYNAGCQTIFINRNYSENKPTFQNFNAESLFQAVNNLKLN